MAVFRKRVLAWNEGEPVLPKTDSEGIKIVHRFEEKYTYCMKETCYAKRESTRISRNCPQGPGYIHNPILRRIVGWITRTECL